MLYSAAIYPDKNTTLEEASQYKMAHICKRLQLSAQDHLLEIGTGWGGMAIFAAKTTGCRVTSVTISKEQFVYASDWVKREKLENQVNVLLQDYRLIEGAFDKLLSIEMIEAVGHEFYSQYFSKCSSLLKPQGLMLIQAITIQDQRFEYARKNTDFIHSIFFREVAYPPIRSLPNTLRKIQICKWWGWKILLKIMLARLLIGEKLLLQILMQLKHKGLTKYSFGCGISIYVIAKVVLLSVQSVLHNMFLPNPMHEHYRKRIISAASKRNCVSSRLETSLF
jgi:protein-L-isoaspartate O-methyltransferase